MARSHWLQPMDDGEMTALRTVPTAFCAAARKYMPVGACPPKLTNAVPLPTDCRAVVEKVANVESWLYSNHASVASPFGFTLDDITVEQISAMAP